MSLLSGNLIRFGAQIDNRVSRELGKMRGDFDRVTGSKGFASIVQGVGLGIGLQAWQMLGGGISGVIGTIQGSIDAASNMNETITKSQAVFGDAADELEAWSGTAATAMGQSSRLALESAASFGNLFKSMGVANTESVHMSKSLVQLASDLASFNNQNPEEVLQALRSGLVGEVEPLRRFGVAINAAAVENKALEMGLAATRKELTEGDKVQARYALVLEQTATAQGDYARTADGLANIQRTMSAQWEDLQIELGEKFLPIVVEVSKVMRDNMIPVMQTLLDNLNQLIPIAAALALAIGGPKLMAAFASYVGASISASVATAGLGTEMTVTAARAGPLRAGLGIAAAGIKGIATALRSIAGPLVIFGVIEALIQLQNTIANIETAGKDMSANVTAAMEKIDVSTPAARAEFERMVGVIERGRQALVDLFPGEGGIGRELFGINTQLAEMDRLIAEMERRATVLADAGFEGTWEEYIKGTQEAAAALAQMQVTALGFAAPIPDSQAVAKPWQEAGQLVVKTVADKLLQLRTVAAKAAKDLRDGMKEGLRSGWGEVESALDEVLERLGARLKPDSPAAKRFEKFAETALANLKKPMTGAQRVDLLRSYLDTSTEMGKIIAQGIEDGDPLVQEAFRELRDSAVAELAKLGIYMEDAGMEGATSFGEGVTAGAPFALLRVGELGRDAVLELGEAAPGAKTEGEKIPQRYAEGVSTRWWSVTVATQGLVNTAIRELTPAAQRAYYFGTQLGTSWVQGVANLMKSRWASSQIWSAAQLAMSGVRGQSPPRVGPLRDIDKWGGNVAQAWVDSFVRTLGATPMVTVPAPAIAGSVVGAGMAGGVGNQTITIYVDGASYGTPDELGAAIAGHLRDTSVWR